MSTSKERKALDNITSLSEVVPREDKKQSVQAAKDMFPVIDRRAKFRRNKHPKKLLFAERTSSVSSVQT